MSDVDHPSVVNLCERLAHMREQVAHYEEAIGLARKAIEEISPTARPFFGIHFDGWDRYAGLVCNTCGGVHAIPATEYETQSNRLIRMSRPWRHAAGCLIDDLEKTLAGKKGADVQ